MTVTTCPSDQQLQAFQLGDLPDEALDELAAHLEGCAQCEARAARLDAEVDPLLAAIRDVSALAMASAPLLAAAPQAHPRPPARAPDLRPPEKPDEIGRLGNYRVLRQLGAGGMSFVYLAEDLALRRPVALKVMKPDLAADRDVAQRFVREARIMAAIKHPHLVTVYQTGIEAGCVYLAMELLHGESLGAWMKQHVTAPPSVVLRLGQEIASGLAVVHRHGLIHRDVKPDNIWLEAPDGAVKILDFGLARFTHDDVNLTRTGTIMGTPSFMAPEQARGQAVDARSDLFSLGCILYCLCTGVRPFTGDSAMAILTALATTQPRPAHLVNPAVPRALSDLVMQLLAKKPEHRPPSAEAVLERLRWLEGEATALPTTVSRRRRVAGIVAATLLVGGILGVTLLAGRHAEPPPAAPPTAAAAAPPLFVSDLEEIDVVNWPFPGALPQRPGDPPNDPRAAGGRQVQIQGKHSPHGVFMHLPRGGEGVCSVSYRIDKQHRRFEADVSLNDGPPECIPLSFTVFGDGKLLWQSKPVTSQADRQTCSVSVEGVSVLKLQMTGIGDERGTHGVWIEPQLTK